MSHRTTVLVRQETLVQEVTQRLTTLVQQLAHTIQTNPPTLLQLEQHILSEGKELLLSLMTGLVTLFLPTYDAPEVCCSSCGTLASYQRDRSAKVLTLLGSLQFRRPYYYCASCRQGFAPLDQHLQLCAGSVSAGLDALLALLGAQADSFEAAVPLLEELTLVRVAPNTVRTATERLGDNVALAEQELVAQALAEVPPAPLPGAKPGRGSGPCTYISMDGTSVHLADGWHEAKLGAVYTTTTRSDRQHPEQRTLHAHDLSFVADLTPAETFGPLLWAEAVRRGVTATSPVVVIGDGAHWIWNIAETYFPGAVQIVDWYHATQYVWRAAHTLYGEGTPLAQAWAKQQLDALWHGRVGDVLQALHAHQHAGDSVQEALTYYTNNQARMDYATYRARGLQIGSGSIESGCKYVLSARLKQAGMIWNHAGARAVAKVRARLKSGRWAETLAARPPLRRTYTRQPLAA